MPFKAYTEKYPTVVNTLITKCYVGEPVQGVQYDFNFKEFRGLWDTGAMCSAISNKVAILLGLLPVSRETIGHATGQSVVDVYNVGILLPNNILIPWVEVFEGTFSNFDMLIGMDIISKGDFSISNKDKKTTFSFRLPSYNEIDFVAEYDEIKQS